MFVAVALLAGVEAGCGQFGCCYCHKEQGYVINQGQFQSDCDTGCEYKSEGFLVNRTEGQMFNGPKDGLTDQAGYW